MGQEIEAGGGVGSGAVLPTVPGLQLAAGRGGEPRGEFGGGGGGVLVDGAPEREDEHCGEGFGGGGGGHEDVNGNDGVVVIF